ncbi:neuropeptide S isoform X1 [Microcaecilia unicolor]|uniref:Neuropeptide S isoform X1 n=1 Tax=Microcaecilia unicolor TaxID=1415580 RepID=A0A6P7Y719_9AMPH|nr:neuropeptide S isoform X1 [Microcaecilia unicolor]
MQCCHFWGPTIPPLSLPQLNFVIILWISTMPFWCCPAVSTLSRKSDYCIILLNSCLAEADRSEELAFLKPFLEKSFMKRSFRNGVGTGIKKTSFQRSKS